MKNRIIAIGLFLTVGVSLRGQQDETVNGDLTVTENLIVDGALTSGNLLARPFFSSDLDNTFFTSSRQLSFTSG